MTGCSPDKAALKQLKQFARKLMAEGMGDDEEMGENITKMASESMAEKVAEAEDEMNGHEEGEKKASLPDWMDEEDQAFMKAGTKSPIKDRQTKIVIALEGGPKMMKKGKSA